MNNKALALEIIEVFKNYNVNEWYCIVFDDTEYDSFNGLKNTSRKLADYVDDVSRKFYGNAIKNCENNLWMLTDSDVHTILNDCPIDINNRINTLDKSYQDNEYINYITKTSKKYNEVARKFRRVLRKHGYNYKMGFYGTVIFYKSEV